MRTVSVISEKEEEEEDALEAVASSATLTCEWIPPPHGRGGMQNAILVCCLVPMRWGDPWEVSVALYQEIGREATSTVRMGWISHRKWKETKQQPNMLPGPAVLGCCLVSFHFLWAIHPIRPVYPIWHYIRWYYNRYALYISVKNRNLLHMSHTSRGT